jgi:hypothetical protein
MTGFGFNGSRLGVDDVAVSVRVIKIVDGPGWNVKPETALTVTGTSVVRPSQVGVPEPVPIFISRPTD